MSKRKKWKNLMAGLRNAVSRGNTEAAADSLTHAVEFILNSYLESSPPTGKKKVTNLYVEMVEGNPKLRVEYDE